MKIIKTVQQMQETRRILTVEKIAFVPTMGYLHEGHLSLMRQAQAENDLVIASIFVNPLQFGPGEDLDTYPRDLARDSALAKENGVDILFTPSAEDMYPHELSVTMAVGERSEVLCGRSRPGHFDGVVTVLNKLFHIIQPDTVYLGLKDAQQFAVVAGLIADYHMPINLIGMPTVREASGLAKSSRNVYLTAQEKQAATAIQQALQAGLTLVREGVTHAPDITAHVEHVLNKATPQKIDYIELLSYPTLRPVTEITGDVILATAVYFKQARLIDNLIFDEQGKLIKRIN